jgi:hypothetical protein
MRYPIFDATLLQHAQSAGSYLADLFTVEPMHGASVNGWVDIPLSFVICIYAMVIIITAGGCVYYMKQKNPFVQALRKSMVVAFFCSGFLYLVYSERTWYTWVAHDVANYAGKSIAERSKLDFGSIYDFAMTAQQVLKDSEYTLYASNRSFSLIAQYYLLPRRNRADTRNILVLYDPEAVYDESTKTFIRGARRIENAEMLLRYDVSAYVLRVR